MNESRAPWPTWVALGAVSVQACASLLLLGGPPGDPTRIVAAGLGAAALLGLPVNAAALVVAALRARRRAVPGTALLAFSAAFLAWHVFALGALAGWWSSGLEQATYIAGSTPVSLVYQAVMCCSFTSVLVAGWPRRIIAPAMATEGVNQDT
ncbi:hypothetical protein SAMN05192558_11653 [Actinokineospora alba]|uniref:Uncharacterized protein n=1 Tax=Actinokineospora alba TaxID=504798 RepID=A0A1H0VYC9_9PSEU|nr:hypothetical protein [Actinokineospora alba]TDP67103.1 hypothetical protein C8E96_2622 [Actinokineospora alba]SDJ46773.1 hypothetical protein SAMN05421871_11654 [Actinokineospora alba]SDP83331.1 hypothetical protein SAMN05192558_11653 [Actinokineospora alba]